MSEAIWRYREARAGERGLFPVDDEGRDILGALKLNRDVGGDIRARRNPRHHRLFFQILQFCKLHCEIFANATLDQIKDALKLATGCATKYIDAKTGQTYYVLDSISWAAMDQTRFARFFDDACAVIAERWMPEGTTPEDVRRELLLLVDGEHAVDQRSYEASRYGKRAG